MGWKEMWGSFDQRKAAKVVNDAEEDVAAEGDDMFTRAGVAAE